jgi:hypothetical protein
VGSKREAAFLGPAYVQIWLLPKPSKQEIAVNETGANRQFCSTETLIRLRPRWVIRAEGSALPLLPQKLT